MRKSSNFPKFLDSAQERIFGGTRWLVLVDPALDGEENMRRDRELLEWAYSSGESLPVLRFFLWRPPAISLGYMQPESDIDAEKCARDGIDIVRRPTGGRAILHSAEFTYSVTLPPWHPLAKMTILQTYNEISRALALGLRNLGIPAKLARGTGRINPKNPSCFSSTSRYELVVDGKKLVGSAQRRKNGAALQQGSIMADEDFIRLADYLTAHGDAVRRQLQNHSTWIKKILGYIPAYEDFVESMIEGFEAAFHEG